MTTQRGNRRDPRNTRELLRSLPSVTALLAHDDVRDWLAGLPRAAVTAAIRSAIEDARRDIVAGKRDTPVDIQDLLARAESAIVTAAIPAPQRVINATGIVLHTGLGRAPLCDAAIDAMTDAAHGYCDLEYDLATGTRGRRTTRVAAQLADITGAEAATVVNNNAAATLMILATFARNREVVVSRGQLVEIGGSFRLPDIMAAGGAILREVGTTNRTRIDDYDRAITDQTAILMRVHTSNFHIVGFTEHTPMSAIADLAHRHALIAVDDLGSGALVDLARYGLPGEPVVGDAITAGADLACFSGDKLLGGPQCGVIVGRAELIHRLEANPLMRTYRVDKLTLSALDATLRHYQDPDDAVAAIPTLAMLAAKPDELAPRAHALCEQMEAAMPGEHFYVGSDVGFAGGGSLPGRTLETVVVQWRPARSTVHAIAAALRDADVPVIVRIRDDAICFDLRTIRPTDQDDLIASVTAAAIDDTIDNPVDDTNPQDDTDGVSLPIL
ncbi:MAG: L-seryl-tRNA(Sec) selenium transferase [Phycisphaerae bacterium]